jgi:hypothetical protein
MPGFRSTSCGATWASRRCGAIRWSNGSSQLERFCLGSPAALTRVRDTSENGMAVVASIKAGEMLRVGAVQEGAALQRRRPGLSIVILPPGGGTPQVAYESPQMPALDVTPSEPEAEPVPADTEAE